MTKQKTPHTQSQQNIRVEQTDFDPDQVAESDELDQLREGARTAGDRSFRKVQTRSARRKIEPATAAYTGSARDRAAKGGRQGITPRAREEESRRQEKVVRSRPDARAGVNRSR